MNFAPVFALVNETGVDAENNGNGGVQFSYEISDTSCILAPLTIAKVIGGPGGVRARHSAFDVTVSCVDPTG